MLTFFFIILCNICFISKENSQTASFAVAKKTTTTTTSRKRSKIDRDVRRQRKDCEESPQCFVLPPHENNNCINQCLSSACYEQIFASDPLEDGEVDKIRTREFSKCLRNERKQEAKVKKVKKQRN